MNQFNSRLVFVSEEEPTVNQSFKLGQSLCPTLLFIGKTFFQAEQGTFSLEQDNLILDNKLQ